MLEKLALSKIAFCKAPALSSASSACLGAVLSLITTRMTDLQGRYDDPGNRSASSFHGKLALRLKQGLLILMLGIRMFASCVFIEQTSPKRSDWAPSKHKRVRRAVSALS